MGGRRILEEVRLETDYNSYPHSSELNRLLRHLDEIGEDRHNADLITKEAIWVPHRPIKMSKFPDLIIVHGPNGHKEPPLDTGYAVIIELKANGKAKRDAVKQICHGKIFTETRWRLPVPYGKFVTYMGEDAGFSYDTIEFDDYLHDFSSPPEFTNPRKYRIDTKNLDKPVVRRRGRPKY